MTETYDLVHLRMNTGGQVVVNYTGDKASLLKAFCKVQ